MNYHEILQENLHRLEIQQKISSSYSTYRSLVGISAIFLLYFLIKSDHKTLISSILVLCVILFLVLVSKHSKILRALKILEAKVRQAQKEVNFLDHNALDFDDGNKFAQTDHDYSFDLDFFGGRSFYHHINRTNTSAGAEFLAKSLTSLKSSIDIMKHQDCFKELSLITEWRHHFNSLASLVEENPSHSKFISSWANENPQIISPLQKLLSFLVPIILWLCLIVYFLSNNEVFYTATVYLFIINLILVGRQFNKIKIELNHSEALDVSLKQYSLLLKEIEKQKFSSEVLLELQTRLHHQETTSSRAINKLSTIYNTLNTAANPMGAMIFNGLFQFHLHAYLNLLKWKATFGKSIQCWLEVIGEMECAISIANYAYHNPSFVFPNINDDNVISFTNLGHPLISQKKRIGNDIVFQKDSFYVLTGSNMSGKSTFLRALGLNMVIAGIGGPVCATHANIHPKKVLVSMRVSDSLDDDKSYFFSEILRLKYLLDEIGRGNRFILLDEILRGTNSEDKQYGTIKYIVKLLEAETSGIVATHDLAVCNMAITYPDQISNIRFEVEIVNNDLVFDYKLKPGICESKNASFLMEKLGII